MHIILPLKLVIMQQYNNLKSTYKNFMFSTKPDIKYPGKAEPEIKDQNSILMRKLLYIQLYCKDNLNQQSTEMSERKGMDVPSETSQARRETDK